MIAIISWLYQRELKLSAQRLEVARQKVLEGELLRRDLAVARELQQRLYPPPPLTNSVINIASRSEPARETSGDFYDFIKLDHERLGIVVADVTGKSIAAALVMAMARSTVRSEATRHVKPSEVLHYANQTLCNDNTFKEMITAFYGVLDTNSLRFAFSNAGHPYPVLRRNGQLEEMEIGGLPLGSSPIAMYSEQEIELQPGDQLFLVSDGLYEEMNSTREMFGFPRMMEAIAKAHPENPHYALNDIWTSVEIFRGDIEQSDDITLMVLQVIPTAT
ncbi:PP2C family protein-serine/threonine phosphatase [Candidatus Oscillochloris fontis]|uniref:PP2C family protein-serine/threonine phosphatase n=1 Tax=Candidatus Oscillochloris fontis TaxID=2496868 RepID=UPI001375E31C|nr:PP2C family protein-serine/threonine phosphatase [Candidatus Oscillochloris fontis]